jgi:hypothetical protein
MGWKHARQLVLPTALTVTSFAVVLACGGEDEPEKKTTSAVVACSEAPTSCQKCKDDTGKVICGPSQDCYADTSGGCAPGGSS